MDPLQEGCINCRKSLELKMNCWQLGVSWERKWGNIKHLAHFLFFPRHLVQGHRLSQNTGLRGPWGEPPQLLIRSFTVCMIIFLLDCEYVMQRPSQYLLTLHLTLLLWIPGWSLQEPLQNKSRMIMLQHSAAGRQQRHQANEENSAGR